MPYTPPTPQAIDDNNDAKNNFSKSIRRSSAPPPLKVIISSPRKEILPCLVKKKSGEIVKPSLKNELSKSEPVTPTFTKFVHFNEILEQIRLFNNAQRPQAISADVSDDEDNDFNFSEDEEVLEEQLKIYLPNMPILIPFRNSKLVYVESIFLSKDKRKLQGRIMVQNIAFEKNVNIRYTFDYWSTTSAVSASYLESSVNNFDAFLFSIELIDNSKNSIDGKTMYLVAQYQVDNRDFWDNNNGSNYQVNFKKITSPSSSSFPSTPQNISISQSKNSLDENFCALNESLLAIEKVQQSNNTHTCKYSNENFKDFFPNNYFDGMPMSDSWKRSGSGSGSPPI